MEGPCAFKVPNEKARQMALGSLSGVPFKLKKYLGAIKDSFVPIPAPQPSDWLWSHSENHQTNEIFASQPKNYPDDTRDTIYIQPLEDRIDDDFLEVLRRHCEAFFLGLKVSVIKRLRLEDLQIPSRSNPYSSHMQFNATKILRTLETKLPRNAYCMLGILMTDIYPSDEWNFGKTYTFRLPN
eukprot:TRINITY_DN5839_c0_g1_i3.p1 TRINITY_DN5839_c0_g1~~TRINITY_DN5839_c0_g1_i3.p1  ORF type:complete len:183 (-),score=14.88 TRINITY_DN5839_c0_g1_i3:430-978(-)